VPAKHARIWDLQEFDATGFGAVSPRNPGVGYQGCTSEVAAAEFGVIVRTVFGDQA